MSVSTSKPSERQATLAVLPPLSSTEARTSAYILPDGFHSLAAKVYAGANTATGTLTLLRAANTSGGSTQAIATQAFGGTGTNGNDAVHVFNINPDADLTDERPYLAVQVGAAGTAVTAATIEGYDSRYGPGENIASVTIAR